MSDSNRPVLRYKPGYAKARREAIRADIALGRVALSVSGDGVNWRKVAAPLVPRVPKPPRIWKRRGYVAEDTSPIPIQRLRKAMCDEFIKTGSLNPDLMGKLRAYAESKREGRKDARRRSKNDPVEVSPEHGAVPLAQRRAD